MIHEINHLVLEYLIVNGYKDVAEQFSVEAQLPPLAPTDLADIGRRRAVTQHILAGNVLQAIDSINELDLYFLEENFSVYFSLVELRLLEMVRGLLPLDDVSRCGELLQLAEQVVELLNDKSDSEPYLRRVEKCLALVCYPLESLPNEYTDLVDVRRRKEVAKQVNRALLESRGLESQGKLERVVKLCGWAS